MATVPEHASRREVPPGRPRWWLPLELTALFALIAVVNGTQRYLVLARSGQLSPLEDQIAISFSLWMPWVPLTLLIVALAERFPLEGPRLRRSLGVHLVASILIGPLNLALFIPIRASFEVLLDIWPDASPFEVPSRVLTYLAIEMLRAPITYWVVLGVVSSLALRRRLRERERSSAVLEARLAEAKVQALRRQLNPHFLFNTLNSIATLMHRDVAAAELMLERLGDLLRASLHEDDSPLTLLREEISLIRLYLAIERERFADRLRVEIAVEPDTEEALVPCLILQPLVENAVRHGVAPRAAVGTVSVRAARADGRLQLVVADDGVGLGSSPRPGSGVGLRNTRERLEAMYGPSATMTIGAGPGGGVAVTIDLPFQTAPGNGGLHVRSDAGPGGAHGRVPRGDVSAR